MTNTYLCTLSCGSNITSHPKSCFNLYPDLSVAHNYKSFNKTFTIAHAYHIITAQVNMNFTSVSLNFIFS
jgi:hypothetical protein